MADQQPDGRIHVVLAFDDGFWAPAFAVSRSIALTTTRKRDVTIHLLHDHMKPERRADFDALVAEFGITFAYYALDEHAEFNATFRDMPVDGRLHTAMYGRLLVNRILPPTVRRVIYLDCDTFVVAPIERLFDYDLGGNPIAAVQDSRPLINMLGRDMREKTGIFTGAEPYFNSGVLLIDVEKFAAVDIPARIREMAAKGWIEKLYYDQDILNLVFQNRWTPLPWRFNVIDPRFAHEGMQPFILHYTGHDRPWKLISTVAHRRQYRHVMTNELFYRYMRYRTLRYWKKLGRRLIGRR